MQLQSFVQAIYLYSKKNMAETGSVIYLPDIVKISKIPHILIRDFFYNSWLGVIISSNSLPIFDIHVYGRV